MKNKNILIFLFLITALLLSSCYKSDECIFEEKKYVFDSNNLNDDNYSYSYNVLYKNTVVEYASLEIKEIDNETYKTMNNINCVKNRNNNKYYLFDFYIKTQNNLLLKIDLYDSQKAYFGPDTYALYLDISSVVGEENISCLMKLMFYRDTVDGLIKINVDDLKYIKNFNFNHIKDNTSENGTQITIPDEKSFLITMA